MFYMNRLITFLGCFAALICFGASNVCATKYTTQAAPSQVSPPNPHTQQSVVASDPSRADVIVSSIRHAADKCLSKWEAASCITELGHFSTTLVTFFAHDLEAAGHQAQLEPLRQSCAASTASSKMAVPAYAQSSAMTECANMMYDISVKAQLVPEATMYQFMIMSVMCLNKDQRKCAAMEVGVNTFLEKH